MAGALDGITVIDLTKGPAGALATMFLGDHGAHVIRVLDDVAQLHRDGGYRVWDRGKDVVLCPPGNDDQHAEPALLATGDGRADESGAFMARS